MGEITQSLLNVVMRWVMGSELTVVPLEEGTQTLLELGMGTLRPPAFKLDSDINPVYIEEPLVVVGIISLFQKRKLTERKTWIGNSLSMSPTRSSLGTVAEDLTLMVLMENFRNYTALGDVFHINDPALASRKVALIALKRSPDGVLRCCPVSWNEGASDRFGLKALSPTQVLEFFRNPDGRPFLFPDVHMGPDLACFLQDEQTKEIILFLEQSKISDMDPETWMSAINSVTPTFFYTINVCIKLVNYVDHSSACFSQLQRTGGQREGYAPVA